MGLIFVQTPILTASDCEGAGEQFQVSAGRRQDFFGSPAFLTVSGQLHLECFASAHVPGVYCFGPTFRAEQSHTTRHLAEFWMLEPELTFAGLDDVLKVCQQSIQFAAKEVLEKCSEDLELIDKIKAQNDKTIANTGTEWSLTAIERVESLVSMKSFPVVSYRDALDLLKTRPTEFNQKPSWESGLHTEHERDLANHFQGPVFVTHYPKEQKPFYMNPSGDDTVACMDLLFPQIGEIAGGSERIHEYDVLLNSMQRHGLNLKAYEWYSDLRKFGSVPHAGFGIGFDRVVQYLTGMLNIRDVVPVPRAAGSIQM
jgi:asparaginyl-tRNA synthetase